MLEALLNYKQRMKKLLDDEAFEFVDLVERGDKETDLELKLLLYNRAYELFESQEVFTRIIEAQLLGGPGGQREITVKVPTSYDSK